LTGSPSGVFSIQECSEKSPEKLHFQFPSGLRGSLFAIFKTNLDTFPRALNIVSGFSLSLSFIAWWTDWSAPSFLQTSSCIELFPGGRMISPAGVFFGTLFFSACLSSVLFLQQGLSFGCLQVCFVVKPPPVRVPTRPLFEIRSDRVVFVLKFSPFLVAVCFPLSQEFFLPLGRIFFSRPFCLPFSPVEPVLKTNWTPERPSLVLFSLRERPL